MRLLYLAILMAFLVSCGGNSNQKSKKEGVAQDTIDLKEIRERGRLVALTSFSSTSYFIYRGQPMGFEYELLQRFADEINVDLSIRVMDDLDSVIPILTTGEADLIAANYTVTRDRNDDINFSSPVMGTRQVLIQRLPENWWKIRRDELDDMLVRDPLDLIGKRIHVRKESSFYTRLSNLMEEIGDTIEIVNAEGKGTEELIEMVSKGEIDYTVADENVALLNKGYYPNIDIQTPLSFSQRIAWGVRKESVQLLDTLNAWLEDYVNTKEYAVLYLKYFKARSQHKERVLSEYSSLKGDKLSPFDPMIKKESKRLNWDWKLLTAMIFQESKFVPDAESWVGAGGLMQLIPETANRFGAENVTDPQQNIRAGVSFLQTLQDYWANKGLDSTNQIKFILASYNVGLGHVLDAVRLAKKFKDDHKNWDSVAVYLEKKSEPEFYNDEVVKHGYCRGSEPVKYVEEVLKHYEHYSNITI